MNIYEKRIAPLFAETGKNDKELETIIGLPKGIIYNWKSGRSKNFEAYIPKIAKHFKVSADYLMGIDTTKPPVEAEGVKEAPATEGEGEKDALIEAVRGITDKDTALAVFDELSKKMRELM